MHHRSLTLALLLSLALPLHAESPPQPITAAERHTVIATLGEQLQSKYVFPEAAAKLATALRAREAEGAYAGATDVAAFAEALGKDMRTLGKDGHFSVEHAPDFKPRPQGYLPSSEELAGAREEAARYGYGIEKLTRLPGNVGYFELRGFGPTELVGDALTAAMTVLSGTDAMIIDLRRNGGGEPNTVAHLMSHFFAQGDERHLNDLYSRASESTRQYWTNPAVAVRYVKPVYVLTSKRTFSGGEEFSYDMQTQKRGVIVGESTGGGSNPGDMYPVGAGFIAFIPDGRAINPVTKTNWEHTGVKPDIAVPAADAQKIAHAASLKALIAASTDDDEKTQLRDLLAKVESDTLDPPSYAPPR